MDVKEKALKMHEEWKGKIEVVSRAKVVDADDLDLRVIQRSAHDHAADTAETIDTDFDAHKKNFLSDGIY